MASAEIVAEYATGKRVVAETRPFMARQAVDPDSALVTLIRRGDAGAAEALVEAYGARVYRLAVRITGNHADAEEVMQDSLWSVLRKIDTFRGASAFGSWLYRIAANAAYQKVRGRRRHEMSIEEVLPAFHEDGSYAEPIDDWSPLVDDPCQRIEIRQALEEALAALSTDDRVAVLLHDVEGFKITEVAAMLGMSPVNVKSHLHRARLFLRRRLAASLSCV
jgi:RNA polymerase sigma-70 factor, ECF subfamily